MNKNMLSMLIGILVLFVIVYVSYGFITKNENNSVEIDEKDPIVEEQTEFTIEYHEDYYNDTHLNVILMEVDSAIIMSFTKPVTSFKITDIIYDSEKSVENEILYENNSLNEVLVIRTKIAEDKPNIKISFIDADGEMYEIVPTYNNDTNTVDFK